MRVFGIAAFLAAASFSLLSTAAIAQWDDAPAIKAAEQATEQKAQPAARATAVPVSGTKSRDPYGYENYFYEGSAPQKKFRMITLPNGATTVVEDKRGPAPVYGAGFGQVSGDELKEKPQANTIQPGVLLIPAEAKRDPMFENYGAGSFFGGLKPSEYQAKPIEPVFKEDTGPAWAKDRIKTRKFIDGKEQFGNEDPQGFF